MKGPYSFLSNCYYSVHIIWESKYRKIAAACFLSIPVYVLQPFLTMLIPKIIIDITEGNMAFDQYIVPIGIISIATIALSILKGYIDADVNQYSGSAYIDLYRILLQEKLMDMDYDRLEDPQTAPYIEKAKNACVNNNAPAMRFLSTLVSFIVSILNFLLYGAIVSAIDPVILLLLFAAALINWFMLHHVRNYENSRRQIISGYGNKLLALASSLRSAGLAKDMRMYSLCDVIKEAKDDILNKYAKERNEITGKTRTARIVEGTFILLRDGIAYAYMIRLYIQGRLSLGNFVMMLSAIANFSIQLSSIIIQANELLRGYVEIGDLRSFLDLPDRMRRECGYPVKKLVPPFSIDLENVSYQYAQMENPLLSHINLHINPGECIALVGSNGEGKTTLVKLLCGLYRPKEGKIRLDNRDISSFDRDEYYSLFSVVFQDIHLMPTTIACNVSQCSLEKADLSCVKKCLKIAGLYNKIQGLPQKEHTMLVRSVNEDAIDLSGGELQKLALARAVYRDAPIIILDEPTAALDPIAESEMYQQYAALTKGKTSFYISHRLASTRFCDRILLLKGGGIVEEGTHNELMHRNGHYAHLYRIQSSYYRKNKEAVW